jgi:hypothetical protein
MRVVPPWEERLALRTLDLGPLAEEYDVERQRQVGQRLERAICEGALALIFGASFRRWGSSVVENRQVE